MFEEIGKNLFTLRAVITTLLHVSMAVGVMTSWILFTTQVLGVDPMAAMQQPSNKAARR